MAVFVQGYANFFFNDNTKPPTVSIDETIPSSDMFQKLDSILSDERIFRSYVFKQVELDDTWKFWLSFVFTEGLVYIQLFIAIRCQNWEMRVSALKLMAPTFNAYDRAAKFD